MRPPYTDRRYLPLLCVLLALVGCNNESKSQSPGAPAQALAISGTPATTVTSGNVYVFQPIVTTSSSSSIGYSIKNKPAWAQFSTVTGKLIGTPTAANIGVYSNIVISVSTAKAIAALPAFSVTVNANSTTATSSGPGTVSLTWSPPTENTDGTTFTDLAGFHIYYGTSDNFTRVVDDETGSVPAGNYTITGLTPGTYVFQICAYNALGIESAPSNQVSVTVS